jgi:hypothetical protein
LFLHEYFFCKKGSFFASYLLLIIDQIYRSYGFLFFEGVNFYLGLLIVKTINAESNKTALGLWCLTQIDSQKFIEYGMSRESIMSKKLQWEKFLTILAATVCVLAIAASAGAVIGTEKWSAIYNDPDSPNKTYFLDVGFLPDGRVSAVGNHPWNTGFSNLYDVGGRIIDPAEWISQESSSCQFRGQYIDAAGNFYFAGMEYSSAKLWKYNSNGTLDWEGTYSGLSIIGNYNVALDSVGNSYTAGIAGYWSNQDGWDGILHKFKPDGSPAGGLFPIVLDYEGLKDGFFGVAVDAKDNVIVTGNVTDAATNQSDAIVQKYDGSGTLLWSVVYDGAGLNDVFRRVTIDSQDNILIAGYTNVGTDDADGAQYDWLIVKYDKDGTLLWKQTWDDGSSQRGYARQVVLDEDENFYVVGEQKDSNDMGRVVVQYRDGQTGALLKSQKLSHIQTHNNNPSAEAAYEASIALQNGKLVVSGYILEDPAPADYGVTGFVTMLELVPGMGSEEWSETFYSPNSPYNSTLYGVDFLDDTTAFVSGSESSSIGMGIRYDVETGQPLDTPPEWITQPSYPFNALDVGASGSLYLTGYNASNVYKYDPDGTVADGWPVSPTMDHKFDISEDNSGNVYIVGEYNEDWRIVKYNSDGSPVLGFPMDHDHAGLRDYVYRITIDNDNNFIAAGIITQADGNTDWLIRKYSSDGTSLLWEKIVDGAGYNDHPGHILVDEEDNVIVCGRVNDGTSENGYVVKYAKDDGALLWEATWDSGRDDIGDRMVLDAKGNLYIAVRYKNSEDNWRYGLQYRNGWTGILLKDQNVSNPTTYNDSPETESNIGGPYLALNGGRIVLVGYTFDTSNPADHQYTGLVTLLSVEQSYNVIPGNADPDCSDGTCNLQAALSAAENNLGKNTVLKLQQGTYTGNFMYAPSSGNNGDLTISGGYSADFTTRTLNPNNTILDGGNTGGVLQLNPGIVAGMSTVNGNLFVEGITVQNGNAQTPNGLGGGILALTNPPGTIAINNNIIKNNHADEAGGGCAVAVSDFATANGGDIYLFSNIISSNSVGQLGGADGNGGGCAFMVTGETVVANNLVSGNTVGNENSYITPDGGGLDFDLLAGELILTNNTVADNTVLSLANGTATGGGLSMGTNSSAWAPTVVELHNNIIFGNQVSTSLGEDIHNRVISAGLTTGSALSISCCDYDSYFQSTDSGTVNPALTDNINNDPLFSSSETSLYSLISGSPCIDSGNNNAPAMPPIDLSGATRPQDGNNDGTATSNMGCYEEIVYNITASAGDNGSLDVSTPSPQTVDYGATVQFTFNAAANYHVATVSGCGVNYTNSDNSVTSYTATTAAVTSDCAVTATFSINQYAVTANAGDNGFLDASTPSPQTVDHGATAQFTFNAAANYHVATVSGCGIDYSNSSNTVRSHTVTTDAVMADCAVSATFERNQWDVESSVSGSNGTITPSGTTTVAGGSTLSFVLEPASGYHPAVPAGTCPNGTLADNGDGTWGYETALITSDCTVIASFTDQYTLSVVFEGNGMGTVISTPAGIDCTDDCSAEYQDGTEVTLTATADEGSTFVGWSGSDCSGTDDCTVTMDQAREITAEFKGGFPWTMFLPAILGEGQN